MAEERKTILAIGGHGGDMELTTGAVMAKYAKKGWRAVFLGLTPGEKGHPTLSAHEYCKQKLAESHKAAALLGCESMFLDYKDAELPRNDEAAYKVCDIIRELKPTIVLTHWSGSMHKDHENTHYIVKDAVFYAGLRTIERSLPHHGVSQVYYADNWEDPYDFKPEVFIDITETRDLWIQAMNECAYARGETSGFNFVDYYSALSKVRGEIAGFPYAQAFAVRPGSLEQRVQFFHDKDDYLVNL